MSSFVLNNQLRYQGSANYAMVAIVIGAIINIGLDPLLMFGLNLDIKGAAYATIISQIVIVERVPKGALFLQFLSFLFQVFQFLQEELPGFGSKQGNRVLPAQVQIQGAWKRFSTS